MQTINLILTLYMYTQPKFQVNYDYTSQYNGLMWEALLNCVYPNQQWIYDCDGTKILLSYGAEKSVHRMETQ